MDQGHDNTGNAGDSSPYDAHRYERVDRTGVVQAPTPYVELAELIRQGRLFRSDIVCKNEGPELSAGEYPEFAEIFDEVSPPAQSLVDEVQLRREPAFVGHMEPLALAGVFSRLLREGRTGRLFVRNTAGEEWSIAFHEGRPINTASNLTSESIGTLLKSQGLIDDAAFEEAVDLRRTGGAGRIGSALVTLDKVSQRDLHRTLSVQAMERLLTLFRQTDGTFRFVADATVADDEIRLVASVRDIIETGLASAIAPRDVTQIVNDMGDPVLMVKVPEVLAPGLSAEDRTLLDVLGEGLPLSKCMPRIAQAGSLTIAEARTRVLALIKYGVAGVPDGRFRELEATLERLQGLNFFRVLDVRRSDTEAAIHSAHEARCAEYGANDADDDSEMVRGLRAAIREILDNALAVLGDTDERALYERAIQLGVDFGDESVRSRLQHELHMNKGKALLAQDKPGEAATEFEAAATLMPEEPEAHMQAGWAILLASDRSKEVARECIRRVERSLELRAENDQAYLIIGQIHRLSRNKDEAEQALRHALKINPNNQLAQSELNLLFRRELDSGPAIQLEINLGGIGKAVLLAMLLFGALYAGANHVPGGLSIWPDVAIAKVNETIDPTLRDTAAMVQIRNNYSEDQVLQAARALEPATTVRNKIEGLGVLAKFELGDVQEALAGTRKVPPEMQLMGNAEYFYSVEDVWWWARRGGMLLFGLLGMLLIARKEGVPFRIGGERPWWVIIALIYGVATGLLAPPWPVITQEVGLLGGMALVHVLAEQVFFVWFLGRVFLKSFEDIKPVGVGALALVYGVYQLTFFAVVNAEGADAMSVLQDVGRMGAFVGGAYGLMLWRSGGVLAPLVAHITMYAVMVFMAS